MAAQRFDLEPELAEQAAQRARREEAHVRRERVEAVLEPAQEEPKRRAPPMRGGGDGEPAAGAQHAPRLRHQQLHVSNVLERVRTQHEVEGRVVERERRVGIELHQARPLAEPPPGAAERQRGHVGHDHLTRIEQLAQASVAAAQVERAPRAAERAHPFSQVRGGWPAILRDQLPELVVVAAGDYQAPRARKTAGIVFSRRVRSRKTDQRSR